jgi:hypothetical protein
MTNRKMTHAKVLDFVAAYREDNPEPRRVRPLFDKEEAAVLADLNSGIIQDFVNTDYVLTDVWHLFQITLTYRDKKTGELKKRNIDYRAAVPLLPD